MKFNRKNLPKTRNELDQFVRERGLRPYGVVKHKDRDIFIAETDLEMDNPNAPWGYFQTVWFVTAPHSEERLDVGRWIDFDAMHDADRDWTPEAKRKARITTTIEDASNFIDKSIQAGRYD